MDVLLPEDRSTLVEFYPPERPTSATCRFLTPGGTSLLAPTVSVDALSRTVTAVSSDYSFTAATGTGTAVAGRRYWWKTSDDGAQEGLVYLSEVDANVWTLDSGVPSLAALVGDTLYGARMTATITSAATAARDVNYRIEWTVLGADSVTRVYTQLAHVVRTQYRPAVSAFDARDYLSRAWPDVTSTKSYGYYAGLALRASERVWRRVRTSDRFQHLLGAADDFAAAGRVALGIELLDEMLMPPGVNDRQSYRTELEAQMQREIDDAIGSRPYDVDDDGNVSSATDTRPISAISLRRV